MFKTNLLFKTVGRSVTLFYELVLEIHLFDGPLEKYFLSIIKHLPFNVDHKKDFTFDIILHFFLINSSSVSKNIIHDSGAFFFLSYLIS